MSKIVLTGPDDLITQGFTIVDEPTLLDTEVFRNQQKVLEYWVSTIAQMTNRPPRGYQQRYAGMSACRPRNLLAHEQGLGKTYETVLIIMARFGAALFGQQPPLRRGAIQIVAPLHTLKLAWMVEFEACGMHHLVDVIRTERDVRMSTKPIWLLDYDFLKGQTEHGKRLRRAGRQRVRVNKKKKRVEPYFVGKPIWKLIRQSARPHFVAFDEIHMLRSDSDRTEAVEQYVRGVKNRLGLTGTPVDGWISHLAVILRIIYGEDNPVFPWTEVAFTKRFTRERIVDQDYVTGEYGAASRKVKAPGINPDQIPEFYRATRHLMHRLIIQDPEVSGQVKFPPVRYSLEQIQMDPDHQEFYMRAHHAMIEAMTEELQRHQANGTNLRRLKNNVLNHINILREASSMPWALNKAGITPFPTAVTNKLIRAIDIGHDMVGQGRKFIIFTNMVETGNALTKYARETGLNVVRIYADDPREKPNHLTQEEREARIEQLLMDPNVHGAVVNLGLVSTGLTMVQVSAVIHYDPDWKGNKWRQGNSRIIRPAQVHPWCDVFDLAQTGTVDNYIIGSRSRKLKANDEMVDRRFSLELITGGNQSDENEDEDETTGDTILDLMRALIAGEANLM